MSKPTEGDLRDWFTVSTESPDGQSVPVTAETPDAFPFTCLWNAR